MGEEEGRCVVLRVVFTLYLWGLALQGCRGFGRRGRGSQHRGQSGTSGKYEQTEESVIEADIYRHQSVHIHKFYMKATWT